MNFYLISVKGALDGTDSYKPPAYEAPAPASYKEPSYDPPSYSPPSYDPPSYSPPSYDPPSYSPPSYDPPSTTYKTEDFDIKTPKYAIPSYEPPSLTYDRAPSYVPSAPNYSQESYKFPSSSFNNYKVPESPATYAPQRYQRPTYPPTTTTTTAKTTTYSPPAYNQDSYGYSPYEPVSSEPEIDSYGYSPYKPESKAPPPAPEYPQSEFNYNSFFNQDSLSDTFGNPGYGEEPSYRQPIQALPQEPDYAPVTTSTTTTTPRSTTRYTRRTTTTTTTTTSTTTTTVKTQLPTQEYTPGPVYYKPLPPVNEAGNNAGKMQVYNPYDTIYYTPAPPAGPSRAKEAVPSQNLQLTPSFDSGSSFDSGDYPSDPGMLNTPSIYDDEEEVIEQLTRDYPEDPVELLGDVGQSLMNMNEQDPTQRSYLDMFYDDSEYADEDSQSSDNAGFFSSPNFRSGLMSPDIWDMFNSDWGQKVQ